MMLPLVLLVAQTEDPREALIHQLWKADSHQFFKRSDAFGATRLEVPKATGRTHKVMDRLQRPPFQAERFLAGNITEAFTEKEFRVQFVPIAHQGDKVAKPTFAVSEVEKLIRENFGKEQVDATIKSWRTRAYALRAEAPCLSCHNWAKEGDPLGYLVYAIGGQQAKLQ